MSRLVVKNLPQAGLDEEEIKKHFADIDNITDIKLKYNEAGTFRRFAFIGFKSYDAAGRAIEKLNNTFIKNSRIVLEPCKSIKDIKPEKVVSGKKRKDRQYAGDVDDNHHLEDFEKNKDWCGTKENNKNKSKKKTKDIKDIFEEVKDDAEFKEFLNLQRNVGETSKTKQVWADDVVMDADVISAGNQVKEFGDKDEVTQDIKPKKRHKRSRPKKKSTKTKPKELFVHTLKIKGFNEARRKDVIDFFKPLQVLSVRQNKRDEVCYVSFKDESDLKFAMRKDMHFWKTSRIKLWRHDVKRSRVFKEAVREKVKVKEDIMKKFEESLKDTEPLEESGRLFVRNLNYTCSQQDLEQVFREYGELTEIHFPIDKKTSLPKGYAYVEFMFPKDATRAYEELNGTIFQGRNFHLIPSKPKPEPSAEQLERRNNMLGQANAMSSFKRDKLVEQRKAAPRGGNWNILFLGQNALADVVSGMKNVEKSKLLTQQTHKDPIAVRLALGDAMVVEEMRKFLISNGVELDSFDNPQAPRSRTVIIAKNLTAGVDKKELLKLFEPHGRVARVILPPNGLTAIVEMEEPVEAKLAFRKLAYTKFQDTVLYLEWAPINVFREKSLEEQEQVEMKQLEDVQTGTKLLVKNIPFEATVNELKKIFATYGELNFVRLPKKIDGQHRGFGFVDYLTKEDAMRAFRSLGHSTHLYGRKLVLEWAKSEEQHQGSSGRMLVKKQTAD